MAAASECVPCIRWRCGSSCAMGLPMLMSPLPWSTGGPRGYTGPGERTGREELQGTRQVGARGSERCTKAANRMACQGEEGDRRKGQWLSYRERPPTLSFELPIIFGPGRLRSL
jgi:hypothetical protein